MKINWLKVAEFIATYGPPLLEAVQKMHATNQAAQQAKQ